MGGRIVQLVQGERLKLAFDDFEYWIERFSKYPLVQLIDLDAAMRTGDNRTLIEMICKRLPCQVGGGIKTAATCSDYWGQKTVSGAPKGYTAKTSFDQCSFAPAQLRKAYGVTASGLTGKGARVAIVDAYGSSTMLADANRFATAHGDKSFGKGQYTRSKSVV